jgi:hypothetical protein
LQSGPKIVILSAVNFVGVGFCKTQKEPKMRKCLVALTLLFSCINTSFALDGLGTEASPWLIQSLADFDQFTANSTYWAGHTRLDTNLDLTSRTYTAAVIPSFYGTFNGNSHTISNLTINGGSVLGLFGYIENGSVTSLGMENVDISGTGNYVSGLCGYNYGTITNCYSTGSVTGSKSVSGLCGRNDGTIISCYSTSPVTGTESVGGLCGYNNGQGSITNCYSTGPVTGTGDFVGGLCGTNEDGNITTCYSIGLVTGDGDYVGGLCGYNRQTITDCYWDINTAGQTTSDGGWGLTSAQMKQAASYPGWNSGNWTINEGIDTPRLTWQNYLGSIITTGWPTPTYSGSGTEAQPYLIANADDLLCLSRRTPDWSCHFILTADIDLDGLNFSSSLIAHGSSFTGAFNGNDHIIKNLTITANNHVGLFYRLGYGSHVTNLGLEDCDVQGTMYVGGFCGINEDGNITNCYSTGSVIGNGDYVGGLCGLCGYSGGSITSCYSTGSVTGNKYVGGLCGLCGYSSGSITSCYSTGPVTGTKYVGGLCGHTFFGSITDCYSTGSVTGTESVGNLCGQNSGTITSCYSIGSVTGAESVGNLCGYNNGTITNCYSTGSVDGNDEVGGLCGRNSYSHITNSYSIGPVNGTSYVGGLCGYDYRSAIITCYSTGSVIGDNYVGGLVGQQYGSSSIENCYSTGLVTGSNYVGGLIGYLSGTVTGSFWDIQTSGTTDGIGNVNPDPAGVSGQPTAEMQNIYPFLAANWDFVGLWWINQGRDYPKFRFQPFGDMNNDCHVNMYDFAIMAAAWLTSPGDADYNSVCELTGDDVIDVADLAALARQWLMGRQWPLPADFNSNYRVDLVDFAIFSKAWLTSSGQPGYNEDCDLVDDDTINLADLLVFAENFLQGT